MLLLLLLLVWSAQQTPAVGPRAQADPWQPPHRTSRMRLRSIPAALAGPASCLQLWTWLHAASWPLVLLTLPPKDSLSPTL